MELLCVCSGNTCRSPMLQTLLRAALGRAKRTDITVISAGTGADDGAPASRGAQHAMASRGLNLADHASQHIANLDLSRFSTILCMTSAHAAAIRSHGVPASHIMVVNADNGGVTDPYGGDHRAYEAAALILEEAAEAFVASLPAP